MSLPRIASPVDLFFRGRPGDTRLGQWVESIHHLPEKAKTKHALIVLGYPDDQGVRKNRGRAGASRGPDSIRKHFYKMTLPADASWETRATLYDLGNTIVCPSIVETHQNAQQVAEAIGKSRATGLMLGGGHDFAAPTFLGFAGRRTRMGLINIDPHLDTRDLEGDPHSGTPFRVLLESGRLKGPDFIQFGSRPNRNTRSSWQYCVKQGVSILTLEAIREKPTAVATFRQCLNRLSRTCNALGLTIDMDSCAEAEGTSAAPVIGFTAWELVQFARAAGMNPKVRYLELAEVAPALDPMERSSRIAAEILYAFLEARARL